MATRTVSGMNRLHFSFEEYSIFGFHALARTTIQATVNLEVFVACVGHRPILTKKGSQCEEVA